MKLVSGTLATNSFPLARPNRTIVVYMGLHGLKMLCAKRSLSGSTPAAIVQQGTTQNQRVITGALATLPGIAQIEKPQGPTLIIVGGVVSLREKIELV
ncbi:MAG: hypothetical protein Q8O64_10620 [Sideroxyarcus sp.]|nr:hypothetical protein [Sideroxyarcus sp.]